MSIQNCCDKHPHLAVHSELYVKSKRQQIVDRAIKVLEKICAVALGVFSAMTDLKLFVPAFAVGIAIGIYQHYANSRLKGPVNTINTCSTGVMEGLTGVKLPLLISLVANVATAVCHIDHHAQVFVPIMGVSIGTWVGKIAAAQTSSIFHKVKHICGLHQSACTTLAR